MEDRKYKIKLFLYDEPELERDVEFYKNDTNTCIMNISLFKDRSTKYLVDGTVSILINKPDGTEVVDILMKLNDGEYIYELPNSAINVVGNHTVTVQCTGSNNDRTTFMSFKYKIKNVARSEDIYSENDYPILTKLLSDNYSLSKQVNAAEALRGSNEEVRKNNEETRKSNETLRQANFDKAIKEYESYKNVMIAESNVAALQNQINAGNAQLAEMKANKNNQTNLLSKALQKLFTHKQMKFIFQGNSLTYGHDTVSSDKREADTTLCDDGTKHVANRAGVSYPEAMKEYLDKIYPNANHIVINKGYSGDWVERGYQRWNKNSNADIAFIMYGSNDSDLSASWVPSEVRGNLEKFIEDYRKLIERYLRWGTAVVILTPPRTRVQELLTTGRVGEPFRNALILLGKEYNIPVIDTEEFSNGWDSSFYSDGTHFNTKGYRGFASRLVSLLIGFSLIDDVKLYSNENLGVRRTRDNMTVGTSCIFSEAEGSVGQEEFTNNKRLTFHPVNDVGYYSFQTVEDNIVLIPIYGIYGNTNLRFDLDFNTEQGSKTFVADVMYSEYVTAEDKHSPVPSRLVAPNSIGTNSEDMKWILEQAYKNKLYIHITNKGWHNISVEQTNKIGNVSAINGFLVYSYKDFVQLTKEYIQKNVLQLLTHQNWTNSPNDVSTVKILASDLNSIFVGNKLNLSEYYKGIPMKITMMNVDNSIVEYSFLWHDNLSASDSSVLSGYKEGFYKNQIPFIEGQSPNRTITAVTYNKDDRSYNIEFGGNLKALSSIIVQPL